MQHSAIDSVVSVHAGKFRRYHGEGLKQLFDISTMLKNIRDFFYFLMGILESIILLSRQKPDVIFIKGGFVGVPIGLAAAIKRIPYVTHDSDAVPGLANRMIGKWAQLHTVAMPTNVYPYPPDKTIRVGVPVAKDNSPVTPGRQRAYRKQLHVPETAEVVCLTGGGNGSALLNSAMVEASQELLKDKPASHILHVTGKGKLEDTKKAYEKAGVDLKRVKLADFVDMPVWSGAADVIVTRAGANSLADFAAQAKACIVIPNPLLTGGHQIKNAEALASEHAICLVPEDKLHDPEVGMVAQIYNLLGNTKERSRLATQLHAQSFPGAAEKIADILLSRAQL